MKKEENKMVTSIVKTILLLILTGALAYVIVYRKEIIQYVVDLKAIHHARKRQGISFFRFAKDCFQLLKEDMGV